MAAYIQKIRDLMEDKKVTIETLADNIGVSRGGLQEMFRNDDMKVSTLISISKYFKMDVCCFLGTERNEINSIDEVFDTLKEIVKSKMK